MRREYNKLVRDRIPDIIRRDGRTCEVVELSEADYRAALLAKLVEEAQEAATAAPDQLTAEIADLYEVIDATLAAFGISRENVIAEQQHRAAERGTFRRRLMLIWTQ